VSDHDPATPEDLRGSRSVYYTGAIVTLHLVDGTVRHAEISGVLDGLPDEVRDDAPEAADRSPARCRWAACSPTRSRPACRAVVYRALSNGVTVFASGPHLGGEPFTVSAN